MQTKTFETSLRPPWKTVDSSDLYTSFQKKLFLNVIGFSVYLSSVVPRITFSSTQQIDPTGEKKNAFINNSKQNFSIKTCLLQFYDVEKKKYFRYWEKKKFFWLLRDSILGPWNLRPRLYLYTTGSRTITSFSDIYCFALMYISNRDLPYWVQKNTNGSSENQLTVNSCIQEPTAKGAPGDAKLQQLQWRQDLLQTGLQSKTRCKDDQFRNQTGIFHILTKALSSTKACSTKMRHLSTLEQEGSLSPRHVESVSLRCRLGFWSGLDKRMWGFLCLR